MAAIDEAAEALQPTTVLVTGAGLIAAHSAAAMLARGAQVVLYDQAPDHAYLETVFDVKHVPLYSGDITDLPELAAIARRHNVKCIVHSTALIAASVERQPYRRVSVNSGGTIAVAEAARLAEARRAVSCSTLGLYDLDRIPASRGIREDDPVGPTSLYGATKLSAEQLLKQFGRIYNFEMVILRFPGVIGRGKYTGGSRMGRHWNRVLAGVLAGREELLDASLLGTQEYVYAKDAAQAVTAACLARQPIQGAYNIGTEVLHSCSDVAQELRAIVPDVRIRIGRPEESAALRRATARAFDCSQARAHLGYAPRFTMRAALEDYLDELRQHAGHYAVHQ